MLHVVGWCINMATMKRKKKPWKLEVGGYKFWPRGYKVVHDRPGGKGWFVERSFATKKAAMEARKQAMKEGFRWFYGSRSKMRVHKHS